MQDLEKRMCPCCGAPVPKFNSRCDYCGMVFNSDDFIQYVGIRPNMRRVKACARIPDYLLDSATGTQAAAGYAKRDIVAKLAEGLADLVTWRMEQDPVRFEYLISGELWVEEPDARLVGARY